jgi:hypothetical protein
MSKGKKKGGKSNSKAPEIPLSILSTKKHAKIYFCGAEFILLELPDSFDKTSNRDKQELFDSALDRFELSESTGVKCDWQESSMPMEVDLDGNLVGFMFCDKHFALKKEKICTAIQNSLLEEDECKGQAKNGNVAFTYSMNIYLCEHVIRLFIHAFSKRKW